MRLVGSDVLTIDISGDTGKVREDRFGKVSVTCSSCVTPRSPLGHIVRNCPGFRPDLARVGALAQAVPQMSRQYPGGYYADLAAKTSASLANARPERAGWPATRS